jgi:glycosyltransferase involved in cell wall biosynthesis
VGGSADPRLPLDVCVLGSTNFTTGIGMVGFGAAEMFARSFNTGYLPLERNLRQDQAVTLPNGRVLPVCRDPESANVFYFTGVLWNGVHDFNYQLVPSHGLRLAHVHFDSDQLPLSWVDILNERFDGVVVSTRQMVDTMHLSGVRCPVSMVPVALDMDGLLAEPGPLPIGRAVRFVSVGAFHPRKGGDVLVEAFAKAFGTRPDVTLTLHSNLAFDDTVRRLRDRVADLGVTNITISHGELTREQTERLIRRSHVLVSCSGGEGYSIPPRLALAFGKALVISALGGHLELLGPPGVFSVPPRLQVPARYPEIDNGVYGLRGQLEIDDVAAQLQAACEYANRPEYLADASTRRERAAQFTFSRLEVPYCELVDPNIRTFRRQAPHHPLVTISPEAKVRAASLVGDRGQRLHHPAKRVVLAHDGGFFSVFNVFLSHLVWDLRDPRCHLVLPDWDVARMMRFLNVQSFKSFCYGRPGDGNVWTKLFEAPYGLPDELLDDEVFLWHGSQPPTAPFNEHREPTLTYVSAYRLYRSRDFPAIRTQYHRVFRDHVQVRPHLAVQLAQATDRFDGRYMIGAHVRHPSHVVEQPGHAMPEIGMYLNRIRSLLRDRHLPEEGDAWGLFLATDQRRVLARFQDEFGDRVVAFPNFRRTTEEEDDRFEALTAAEQAKEGNQLQHLVAADPGSWGTRMAEEVLLDALALAQCSAVLHVVSNVATAVAFMNPAVQMELMLPGHRQ